jgi:hypothetical protein
MAEKYIHRVVKVDPSIVEITRSGSDEKITCATPHGLSEGDMIQVTGNPDKKTNGPHTVKSREDDFVFKVSRNIDGGNGGRLVRRFDEGIIYALPRTILSVATSVQRTTTKRADLATPGEDESVAIVKSEADGDSTKVTCAADHGLSTGDEVTIAGHKDSSPDINKKHTVTVLEGWTTEFRIDGALTNAGTGGTCSRPRLSSEISTAIATLLRDRVQLKLNTKTTRKYEVKEPAEIAVSSEADPKQLYFVQVSGDGRDTELLAKLTALGVVTSSTAQVKRQRRFLKILKTVLGVVTSFIKPLALTPSEESSPDISGDRRGRAAIDIVRRVDAIRKRRQALLYPEDGGVDSRAPEDGHDADGSELDGPGGTGTQPSGTTGSAGGAQPPGSSPDAAPSSDKGLVGSPTELGEILRALDTIEARLTRAATGKKVIELWTGEYRITPELASDPSFETALMVLAKKGEQKLEWISDSVQNRPPASWVKEVSSTEPTPKPGETSDDFKLWRQFRLTVDEDQLHKNLPDDAGKSPRDRSYAYRVPAVAKTEVRQGQAVVAQSRVSVAQLGTVRSLQRFKIADTGKYDLEWHEETGALKKMMLANEAKAPDGGSDLGTAVENIIQARRQAIAAGEPPSEVEALERDVKLLDLRKQKQELEQFFLESDEDDDDTAETRED